MLVGMFEDLSSQLVTLYLTCYHKISQRAPTVTTCVWDSQAGIPDPLLSAICLQLENGLISQFSWLQSLTPHIRNSL